MNVDWSQIVTVSALSGFVGSILLKIFDKLLDNYFNKRSRYADTKNEMADRIIKLCSKGRVNSWRIQPDVEEISYITFQLAKTNSDVSELLIQYFSLWGEYYDSIKPEPGIAWLENGSRSKSSDVVHLGKKDSSKRTFKKLESIQTQLLQAAHRLKK